MSQGDCALGLRPRCYAAAERCTEIEAAIERFNEADQKIPDEWQIELEDMERYARGRRQKVDSDAR